MGGHGGLNILRKNRGTCTAGNNANAFEETKSNGRESKKKKRRKKRRRRESEAVAERCEERKKKKVRRKRLDGRV